MRLSRDELYGSATPREAVAQALAYQAREVITALFDGYWLVATLAEASQCTWNLPQDGHPYADGCYHQPRGEGHGVCWDGPYRQAEAIRRAVQR